MWEDVEVPWPPTEGSDKADLLWPFCVLLTNKTRAFFEQNQRRGWLTGSHKRKTGLDMNWTRRSQSAGGIRKGTVAEHSTRHENINFVKPMTFFCQTGYRYFKWTGLK